MTLCAHTMLSCETFDWLLWMRPIESLLGVNSAPSHASGEHAWVSWHRYQPPPLLIRSTTPPPPHLLLFCCQGRDQYSWPNIRIYDHASPVSDNRAAQTITPPITHTDTACTLFGLRWDFLVPLSNPQAYPKHTQIMRTHTVTPSYTYTTVTNIIVMTIESTFSGGTEGRGSGGEWGMVRWGR